jgi:general stress protein YciG
VVTRAQEIKKRRVEIAQTGGRATSEAMTDEEKRERARAGGFAVAQKMTPEQRSERARKAVMARYKNTSGASKINGFD